MNSLDLYENKLQARLQFGPNLVVTLKDMKNVMKHLMIMLALGFGLAACNPNETDNAVENAGQAAGNAVENAGDAAGNAAENAGEAINNAAENTQDAAQNAGENAQDAAQNAGDNAQDAAQDATDGN